MSATLEGRADVGSIEGLDQISARLVVWSKYQANGRIGAHVGNTAGEQQVLAHGRVVEDVGIYMKTNVGHIDK